MNDELITLNEVLNNGRTIYIYPDETTGMWTSWGYSAYHLSRMEGLNHLTGFSDRMQMPCVCISDADFRSIAEAKKSTIRRKDGFYMLPAETLADPDEYQKWTAGLK